MVESIWVKNMGLFLHYLDPYMRKETKRLERLHMKIKQKNIPWSITKHVWTITFCQNALYIYVYVCNDLQCFLLSSKNDYSTNWVEILSAAHISLRAKTPGKCMNQYLLIMGKKASQPEHVSTGTATNPGERKFSCSQFKNLALYLTHGVG